MRISLVALIGALVALGVAAGLLGATHTTSQTIGPSSVRAGTCAPHDIYVNIPALNIQNGLGNSLQVASISYGFQNPVSRSGGVATVGKAQASEVTLSRPVDQHTLEFFQRVTTGTPLDLVSVELRGVDSLGKSVVCQQVDFSGAVVVTGQQVAGSAGGGTPNESMTFRYPVVQTTFGGKSVSWDFGASPTAARVAAFSAIRAGPQVIFSWRMARQVGVAGFRLYAGHIPLTVRVIPVHSALLYRRAVAWNAREHFALRVLLANGRSFVMHAP